MCTRRRWNDSCRERVCEEVQRPENEYEAAATLLGSEPFGQVRLLWQISGLQEHE